MPAACSTARSSSRPPRATRACRTPHRPQARRRRSSASRTRPAQRAAEGGTGSASTREDCGPDEQRLCSVGHSLPGEVVSVSHDASYVTCTTVPRRTSAARTGARGTSRSSARQLRNTMDLRGRPAFAPGHVQRRARTPARRASFDAACGDGDSRSARRDPTTIRREHRRRPIVIAGSTRCSRVHWNGDRDEVEDFEAHVPPLQGSGDCDRRGHLDGVHGGARAARLGR